jgi:ATP-dependent helicase/nuclease subunit A
VALARIAPAFAAVLTDSAPAALEALNDLDRSVLERARAGVARWLPQVDRVPPSELVDSVLRDAAYVFEMRGRRLDQARENVKKMRALIRRVENRGYATLGRLAAYFETLGAGDEANAIIEAAGAVNLMTMHAAKGLEFPIVFLVNLHAPSRGRPAGFSVIERGPSGDSEVAFNQTEGTRLEERREQEELRRLFYVAATRARDRLYFAAEVDKKGRIGRAARSLAALLPDTLAELFATASSSPELSETIWPSSGGHFAFRICRPAASPVTLGESPATTVGDLTVPPAIVVEGHRVVSASSLPSQREAPAPSRRRTVPGDPMSDERLLGSVVHRLFERAVSTELGDEALEESAIALLSPDERVDVGNLPAFAREAARMYRAFRQRDDVRAVLARGNCFYEVPFSAASNQPGEVVRGVFDCLVVAPDGSASVVEFKTGAARPEHERQAAVYREAARAALGLPDVTVHVLYA